MLNPFRRIVDFYWRFLVSPIDYARHIGVFVGENSFIATRKWSSEPYLITIGNNVQITSGVAIHTHGGGNSVRSRIPDSSECIRLLYIYSGQDFLPLPS